MELRQLSTFRLLARNLSFSQTAADLGYVQSTISAQIHALEDELGILLFDRLSNQIVLTASGKRLLEYADEMVALAEKARQAVGVDDMPSGTLVVSAPETACTYRLPPMVSRFVADFPQVQLIFRPHPDNGLKHAFTQEGIDLAFIVDVPLENPQFVTSPVIDEHVALVAHPSHPLSTQSDFSLANLVDEPIFLTDIGCSYRKLFEDDVWEAGLHLTNRITFHSAEAIKQFVMAGAGLGVLPAVAVADEIEQGRLAALDWHGDGLMTQLVWHKDKWLSPALQAFINTVQECFGVELAFS